MKRQFSPLIVNVVAMVVFVGVLAGAGIWLSSNPDKPTGGSEVAGEPAPPDTVPDPGAGDPTPGGSTPDGPPALDPLMPPLSDTARGAVKRLCFQMFNTAPEASFEELVARYDARAVSEVLHQAAHYYRSEQHRLRLKEAAHLLANKPVRTGTRVIWPGISVDTASRGIELDATALEPEDGLEFALCSARGKSHESLFRMGGDPLHLAKALLMIGLHPCTPDHRPLVEGDWALFDGDCVVATVTFPVGRDLVTKRLEQFVTDGEGNPMTGTGWPFVGTPGPAGVPGARLLAQATGTVMALTSVPTSLLTNPWPASRDDDHYRPADILPDPWTAVRLTLRPEQPEARRARLDALQADWDAFAAARAQMLVDAGARPLPDVVELRPDELPPIDQPGAPDQQPGGPGPGNPFGPGPGGPDNGDMPGSPFAQPMGPGPGPGPGGPQPGPGQPSQPAQPVEGDFSDLAFAPLTPPLTEGDLARMRELIGALSGDADERHAAFEQLCALDSRYEQPMDAAWKEMRAVPEQADVLARAIDVVAFQPLVRDGIVYWRNLAYDPERRLVIADAIVAPFDNVPLEFLVCGPRGKGHESVFMLNGHARNLETAIERMGLRASAQQPLTMGDWRLYDGDHLVMQAAWRENPEAGVPDAMAGPEALDAAEGIAFWRAEKLVIDRRTGAPMADTGFAYTGSYNLPNGGFAADASGAIVGCLTFPQTVLENPWPGAGVEHNYLANRERVPEAGTPVRLVFSVEPPERTAARRERLAPVWEAERLKRPSVQFDPRGGWQKVGARTDFVWTHAGRNQASLAVMIEGRYTQERTITDDYKAFVREKTQFSDDFDRFGEETDTTFDEHLAWRFAWIDTDGAPVLRMVVMTTRFYYQVFFFWPGQTDIEAANAAFDEALAQLDLGHPENNLARLDAHDPAIDERRQALLGTWTVDVDATVRNDPRNADKSDDELAFLIRMARQAGTMTVEITADTITTTINGEVFTRTPWEIRAVEGLTTTVVLTEEDEQVERVFTLDETGRLHAILNDNPLHLTR